MSSAVAAGAAAVALYVYYKQKQPNSDLNLQPVRPVEACRDVERTPNNWSEALYHVKEAVRCVQGGAEGGSRVQLGCNAVQAPTACTGQGIGIPLCRL